MNRSDLRSCPKCGASLRISWNACPLCGTWLAAAPRPFDRPWSDVGISPILEEAEARARVDQAKRERAFRVIAKRDDPA